jgi:hypothetical protein
MWHSFSPVDLSIVKAVANADTAMQRKWARTDRPVRRSAGVYISMECDTVRETMTRH